MENILLTPSEDPDGIIVKKIKTPTGVMVKIVAPVGVTVKIEVENYTLPLAVEKPTTISSMPESEIVSDTSPEASLSELSGPPKSATPRFKSKKSKKTTSQLYDEYLERFLEGGKFKPLKGWEDGHPLETTPSGKLSVRQLTVWSYDLYATDDSSAEKTGIRVKWRDDWYTRHGYEYLILRLESFLSSTTPPKQVLDSLQNQTELARVKSGSFLDLSAEKGKSYVYKVQMVLEGKGDWIPVTRNSSIIEDTIVS